MAFKYVSQSLRDLWLDLRGPQAAEWARWWVEGGVADNLMAPLSLGFIRDYMGKIF